MLLDGAQQAVGHLLRFLVEGRVNAGDDDVHLLKYGVGEVEFTVGEDVDLDAGHDGDAVDLLVSGVNTGDVLGRALVVETVGEGQVLASGR